MRSCSFRVWTLVCSISVLLTANSHAYLQSISTIQGRVVDSAGAVIGTARIVALQRTTALERVAQTDSEGNYQIASVPIGVYRIQVQAQGFQTQIVGDQTVEVGKSLVQDFQLAIGDITQEVTISPASQSIERTTTSV